MLSGDLGQFNQVVYKLYILGLMLLLVVSLQPA